MLNNQILNIQQLPNISVKDAFSFVKERVLSGEVKNTKVYQMFHFYSKVFEMMKKDDSVGDAMERAFVSYCGEKGSAEIDGFTCKTYSKESKVDYTEIAKTYRIKLAQTKKKKERAELQMVLDLYGDYENTISEIETAKKKQKEFEEYFRQNFADCIPITHTKIIEISSTRVK